MNNTAVILAAGSGTRMKSEKSKLLIEIDGKTVIERSVEAFLNCDFINEIIVVCREGDFQEFEKHLSGYDISYCFGGSTRQQSVFNAVETIDDCDYIIIHDGARPLVTCEEIKEAYDKALETGAAAVGVPVKDTLKVVDGSLKIIDTPDREKLISIRTPQIFRFSLYCEAVKKAKDENSDFTDDCRLIENLGEPVYAVKGSYDNIKITTPEDVAVAENILKARCGLK